MSCQRENMELRKRENSKERNTVHGGWLFGPEADILYMPEKVEPATGTKTLQN